jgi:2-furoyl-CoA dehydrogenase FAD binding subunit
MKPSAFDYQRVARVEEAIDLLARHGEDAKILAGGQSLVAMMNFRLVEPKMLIDITGVEGLATIEDKGAFVEVGAAVTQARLMAWPALAERLPLLAKALPHVGHFQTRSRGTVCGSIAHSDPSSELPLVLATLGGQVVLRSRRGSRTLSADDFQTGPLSTAREPDELVTAVRLPVREAGAGYAFDEVTQRQGDFAICSVAAIATAQGVRIGVGGVAGRPTVTMFGPAELANLDGGLNAFAWELGGSDDIHATAQYRRQLVRRIGRRIIEEAQSCRT